jgi:dimethylamine/trimethylamine dehydrogenase
MGEAYFHTLAEYFDGKGERDKLRLLARVERRAAAVVQPLLRKHGLMARDEPVLKSLGEADVAAHQDYGWHELMAYIVARYPGYADDFEALERLAPKEDLPALELLTQHEVAAIEFAGKEVAGDADSAVRCADIWSNAWCGSTLGIPTGAAMTKCASIR